MGKRGIVATTLVVLAATAAAWRFGYAADAAQSAHRPPAAAAAVPVTAVSARRQDMPVYLRGIGTVQAEIDPRPFQATLEQATAQRAEDAAQLQSAKLDLQRFQRLAKQQFAPAAPGVRRRSRPRYSPTRTDPHFTLANVRCVIRGSARAA